MYDVYIMERATDVERNFASVLRAMARGRYGMTLKSYFNNNAK